MLELGDQAGQLHRQVGVAAGKIGVVKLYAHGDHASELISGARQSGMPTGQLLAAGKEEIISDLEQQLGPEDWVLVKGSRGMKMETVVRAITDWGNAAENK
jgi:UDP-N-acetylmuramyl pentapeptide synthase